MDKFLTLTISGMVTGAIYSIIASGLTVSYTSTGIFNLSYGAIAFVSALVFFELNEAAGWHVIVSFLVTLLVFAPLFGAFLNFAVFRPLARATDAAKIMATVGLLVALPALSRWIIETGISTFSLGLRDPGTQTFTPRGLGPSPKKTYKPFGDVIVDSNQIVVFVAAAIVAITLWILMRKTSLGLRMRAVVDKAELADLRGVDEGRTSYAAWIIGVMLAALAGIVGAPVQGRLLESNFDIVMFVSAAAAVLGGLRSIPYAFLGGLALGVLQNLTRGYASFADDIRGFDASVPFILLLAGLVFIARDRSRRSGTAAAEVPPPDYLADLPVWRRRLPWAISGVLFVIYTTVLSDGIWPSLMGRGMVLGLIFMSWVVVTGIGGMVSLAQATFVTSAALMTGRLISNNGWPFLPALIVGVALAVVIGVIVALPALRLGGLPLALATLALAFAADLVLFQWDPLRGGQTGWKLNRFDIGPLDLDNERTFAMVMFALVLLAALLVRNLQRSHSGRAMVAVRTSEPAAQTSGLSVVRSKLSIFALSAAIAGTGGVLLSLFNESANSSNALTQTGLFWLATVVLFGIRRPGGAIIAGLMVSTSKTIFESGIHLGSFGWDGSSSTRIPNILFGIGAIQLARFPDGSIALTAAQNYARRLKRRAAIATEAGDGVDETIEEFVPAASTLAARAVHGAAHFDTDGAALALRAVHSGYGAVEVLHSVNLAVRPGSITALLGANGAGKSTLCATAAGRVAVTSGSIELKGVDVTSLRGFRRARAGVVLAPETRGIFPGLTVQENLQLWLPSASERDRAYERFPVLGERRALPASSLSGGEQQMLTLAPLLVRPPEVLIADEPSLGLAPLIVKQIMDVFVELRNEGVALLLVEEKARDVLTVADTVAFIELGRITWEGPRAEVDDEQLAAAYLGQLAAPA